MHGHPHPRLMAVAVAVGALVLGADLATAAIQTSAPHQSTDLASPVPPTAMDITNAIAPTSTTAARTLPGPGQTRVRGQLTSLTGGDAVSAPLALPLTITVPNRGQGDVTISNVTVGGRSVTIVWNAGEPLPLSGDGALDLGPARVDVDATGITWHLDLAPRLLSPGHYVAAAPVAVGSGGLAQPHDSVAFDAGQGGAFITNGDARVHLPPSALSLTGPGTLRMTGKLTVQTSTGFIHAVRIVTFGPGPFELHLRPVLAGGYDLDALVQGSVSAT